MRLRQKAASFFSPSTRPAYPFFIGRDDCPGRVHFLRSGARAETRHDVAFVWSSLQALERLRRNHSLRRSIDSRKYPVDFIDHVAGQCARERRANQKLPSPDYLGALYADHPPDLIIALGVSAANFGPAASSAAVSKGGR